MTRPPRHFQTDVDRDGATVRVRLSGELDLAGEAHLDGVLRAVEQDAERLIIDLGGLSFIDSTGLRLILLAWHRSREDGLRLTVVPGSEQVRRTLRITGLDGVLPLSEDGQP